MKNPGEHIPAEIPEVVPGFKEYLRLALPCVAMMAVEWWAFATREKLLMC